ncbi:MAG: TlpA disulfide reductase family protein, partial [Bacteroidota bacterium]
NNEQIEDLYNKRKAQTKGKVSPKFTAYENYAGGVSSLDDYKGTYVYIDIWATWCAPCIKEIPHLKKLEESYHDENITFISISVDQEMAYDKWKAMIEDKELKGVQLLADNAMDSPFMKAYLVESIPRFILIDPEGKIIHADAPRPSEPELRELLDEFLLD